MSSPKKRLQFDLRRHGEGFAQALREGLYLLSVSGSDFERGVQQGVLIPELVVRGVEAIRYEFRLLFVHLGRYQWMTVFAMRCIGFLYWFRIPRSARRQIRGLYHGLRIAGQSKGISIWDLGFFNGWPDSDCWLRSRHRKLPLAYMQEKLLEFVPHCSAFFLSSKRAGEPLFGQNIDYIVRPEFPQILSVHHNPAKPSIAGVHTAGCVGFLCGVNSYSMAVGEVGRLTEPFLVRTPWQFQLKLFLEEDSVDAATQVVRPSGYGHNYLLADSLGRAAAIEMWPGGSRVYRMGDQHWLGRVEYSMAREARMAQLRSARRGARRGEVLYARRRQRLMERAVDRIARASGGVLEGAKSAVNRLVLTENQVQLLHRLQRGVTWVRLTDRGNPAFASEWFEWNVHKFWIDVQVTASILRIRKFGTVEQTQSYEVSIEGKDGWGSPRCFVFTIRSGFYWEANVVDPASVVVRDAVTREVVFTWGARQDFHCLDDGPRAD